MSRLLVVVVRRLHRETHRSKLSCITQPSVRRSHKMLKRDYPDQDCSAAYALEFIGERWTLLVIRDIFAGFRRFDQIQEDLGVARNVLASRLQRLVEEG